MKVVTSHQMADLESEAYRHGASETDFMEEAGSGIALIVQEYVEKYNLDRLVILLCGKGNNGGDAYVAGIHLLHLDYEVFAIPAAPIAECTSLCKQNYERFINEGGRLAENLAEFPTKGIIVDGLFGTGFYGTSQGQYAALIDLANNSDLPIISVDIPSGLNGDNGIASEPAIFATETAFLGMPKLGFFLEDGWNHVGKPRYVDFGLGKDYIKEIQTEAIMLSPELLKPLLPHIQRNRNKYEAGYVVGLSGFTGMSGAALLASAAVLRSGAGLMRLLHPEGMQAELGAAPYELLRSPYKFHDVEGILSQLNQASATFIGPGIGRSQEMRDLMRSVLPHIDKSCVIDADALTILAEEQIALPQKAVLTPHMGELMRLLKISQKPKLTLEFLRTCKKFAAEKNIVLVLKGGPSFILFADAPIYICPVGDPGMATAGSGDALTGLLAGLLAQGLKLTEAALLGVYLHGLAGEYAADELTSYSLVASDIIHHFPAAFKSLLY